MTDTIILILFIVAFLAIAVAVLDRRLARLEAAERRERIDA